MIPRSSIVDCAVDGSRERHENERNILLKATFNRLGFCVLIPMPPRPYVIRHHVPLRLGRALLSYDLHDLVNKLMARIVIKQRVVCITKNMDPYIFELPYLPAIFTKIL